MPPQPTEPVDASTPASDRRVAKFSPVRFGVRARRDLLAAMRSLPAAPVVRAGLQIPLVVVQGFAAAQEVLIADADSYARPGMVRRIMADGLGENLFTVDGDSWLRRRQPVAPMFAIAQMNGLSSLIAHSVDDRVGSWRAGVHDAQRAMTDLTLDVACRAILGTNFVAEDIGAVIRAEFETIVGWLSDHLQNPLLPPAVVPTLGNRRMQRSRTNLDRAISRLIDERRRVGVGGDDLLGRLLASQNDAGRDAAAVLTDAEIVDECVGTMFAGHETTASTLSWALYELAANPVVQGRVAAEGDTLNLASEHLFDDAATLPVTDAVVEEVLRLFPPAVSIARVARQRTEIGGQPIRKGTIVLVAVYQIQRDPEVWERPDDFVPDRVLPMADSGLRDSFVAFGLGPRRCLGARFARTEVRLALALICRRWQLGYRGSTPPEAEVAPSLRVRGRLPIEFGPRCPEPA